MRIRRGAPGSQADVHPNALAGMVVRAPSLGQDLELWVTWSASPLPAAPPRLVIDFGDGWVDNISCGGCLLRHAYDRAGRYTVKVLMDDRVGGTTTRTFTLDVTDTCGTGIGTSFDEFAPGTPGSALNINGLSVSPASLVIPPFSTVIGQSLIVFVGDGDLDLTFNDDQAAVQIDFAYQAGFPATFTVFDGAGRQIASTPAGGTFDLASFSMFGSFSLNSGHIRRVVLGNGSNGVLVDRVQSTAACKP